MAGERQFTAREQRLIQQLNTPARVQAWLNELPYNHERGGSTQRGFRGVLAHAAAHCMEAAMFAATTLEQHGYAPLLMSFESTDNLDHVIFVYRHARSGLWGAIGRSRDIGLNGRLPRFGSTRALARSYMDPYIDATGRITGFGVMNLATAMGSYDWRGSRTNLWAVERALIALPHTPLPSSTRRYRRLRQAYLQYRREHDGAKPRNYAGRDRWAPLPASFRRTRVSTPSRSPEE